MRKIYFLLFVIFFVNEISGQDAGFINDFLDRSSCEGQGTTLVAVYNDNNTNSQTWTVTGDGSLFTNVSAGTTHNATGTSGASYAFTTPTDGSGIGVVELVITNLPATDLTLTVTSSNATANTQDGSVTIMRITSQPSSISNSCEGATQMFSITTNSVPDGLEWFRNDGSGFTSVEVEGAPAMTNSHTSSATVPSTGPTSINPSNGDLYKAVVSFSGCSDLDSEIASLSVSDNVSITGLAASGSIQPGFSQSFNASINNSSNGNGNATVTIKLDGTNPWSGDANETMTVGGNLTLPAKTVTVGSATFDVSASITGSNPTVLTVTIDNDPAMGLSQSFTLDVSVSGPCGTDSDNASITVLPVDLTYFRAQLTSESKVALQWATAFEFNNDYFTIERSFNGINYNPINQIKGAGESYEEISYGYIDSDLRNAFGTVYYRLKQTDFDGAFNYFDVVTVDLGNSGRLDVNSIFQDQNTLNLRFNSPSDLETKVSIYNLDGQLLMSNDIFALKGTNSSEMDISDLAPGFYVLNVRNSSTQVSEKFIKK